MVSQRGGFRALLRSGSGVALAMAVMNVSTYGFTVLAARRLGPQPYGALAGLMAALLVVGVAQLGLQATAARRISADPDHTRQIEAVVLRVTYAAAGALGLVLLLLSPVTDVVLRLDSVATAALVAVTAVPLTVMGGQAGVLQGERRWRPLAVMYVAAGAPRLAIGAAFMAWSPTETAAMLGVTLASFAPVLVGWWLLRQPRPPGLVGEAHAGRRVVGEALSSSQALLGFFALSNVDVIVARHALDLHDAGLYAGGLILTKAVLFLPQFVVVLTFPSMATAEERRHALTRALVVVASLGVLCTLATWLLPRLALVFVGGAEYEDIAGRLWVFAVLGTLLAMLQLLIYAVLAGTGRHCLLLTWVALLALVLIGSTTDSVGTLLAVVLAVDAVLLAALLAVGLRPVPARGRDEPMPVGNG